MSAVRNYLPIVFSVPEGRVRHLQPEVA